MPSKKEENVKLLLDIKFNGSRNEFEEFYGDCVSYQEIEQESYQDLKAMVEKEIGKVKFRKARDLSSEFSLTCRVEMKQGQYNSFTAIIDGEVLDEEKTNDFIENPEGYNIYKRFNFLHNFVIANVRLDEEEKIDTVEVISVVDDEDEEMNE